MFTDVSQGSVPALLPFLIAQRHYSYAAASTLVLGATIASSIVQPAFGHLSDRRSLPGLMPAGLLLAGVGIGLVGVAGSFGWTLAAVVLSGLGVAAFHPEGSRFANYLSGARRASGMSLFSVGGNAGFALGPALTTPLVLAFGLPGTLWLMLPLGLMAAAVAAELPRLVRFRPEHPRGAVAGAAADRVGAFVRLGGVVSVRSFVYFGLVTFVPLNYVGELHSSKAAGNTALTVMLVGGALGTLAGGPLADRFGRRRVIVGSMMLLPPLIAGFLVCGPALATVMIGVIGAVTIATFSVAIVMGQEYLPSRLGVASGVTLGLSIGIGGFGAPLLGLVADAHGVRAALEVVAALPLLALALALGLPRGQEANAGKRRERSRERSARRLAGWRQRRNGPSTRLPWL
jgi:FSR family fosmidomycin resistance protein-like MFS transporter